MSNTNGTTNGTLMRAINGSLTLETMSKEERTSSWPEETTETPNQNLGELTFVVQFSLKTPKKGPSYK